MQYFGWFSINFKEFLLAKLFREFQWISKKNFKLGKFLWILISFCKFFIPYSLKCNGFLRFLGIKGRIELRNKTKNDLLDNMLYFCRIFLFHRKIELSFFYFFSMLYILFDFLAINLVVGHSCCVVVSFKLLYLSAYDINLCGIS